MSGGITLDSTDGATQIEGADGTLADVVTGGDGVKRLQVEVLSNGGGGGADQLVKVSDNDAMAAFLLDKLAAGSNVTLTEVNDGGNETLRIDVSGGSTDELVKVSANDTTPNFLLSKLVAGTNITITENNDGGNETITISGPGGGSSSFKDFASDATGLINNTTTLSQYLRLSVTVPSTTNYKIGVSYTWSLNDGAQDLRAQVEIDDTNVIIEHQQEPKDTAGTGITLPLVGGGTGNTGTNQRHLASGFEVVQLSAGEHTIDLDFAGSAANDFAAIYRACLTIEEWS